MNNQNLTHPAIVLVIRAVLREHGFQPVEMLEAVAEVSARALEAIEGRHAPQRLREWQMLVARTAEAYAVEEHDKKPVTTPGDRRISDDPDELAPFRPHDHPCDPGETPLQLTVLLDMLESGELPAKSREILTGLGDGLAMPEIARGLDLTEQEVRKRLRRMRTRYFRRLSVATVLMANVFGEAEEELEPESR